MFICLPGKCSISIVPSGLFRFMESLTHKSPTSWVQYSMPPIDLRVFPWIHLYYLAQIYSRILVRTSSVSVMYYPNIGRYRKNISSSESQVRAQPSLRYLWHPPGSSEPLQLTRWLFKFLEPHLLRSSVLVRCIMPLIISKMNSQSQLRKWNYVSTWTISWIHSTP